MSEIITISDEFAASKDISNKFRPRSANFRNEPSYTLFISERFALYISWPQLIFSSVIFVMQMVTILLNATVLAPDDSAYYKCGIWYSLASAIASVETIWCLKNSRFWKLLLSFVLHICAIVAAANLLRIQLSGNIYYQIIQLGRKLYPDYNRDEYVSNGSTTLLWTCIVLNSLMSVLTILGLLGSVRLTVAAGRAILCGHAKLHNSNVPKVNIGMTRTSVSRLDNVLIS